MDATDVILRTQQAFIEHAQRELTAEEARECASNVARFFQLLSEWQTASATSDPRKDH